MKLKSGRIKRAARVRKKIIGTREVPRLSVFRSNKYIYAQLIDDTQAKTLAFASDLKFGDKNKQSFSMNKIERAKDVGARLAKLAKGQKIKKIVFDRGGYGYHGRVKAVALGAREGDLLF